MQCLPPNDMSNTSAPPQSTLSRFSRRVPCLLSSALALCPVAMPVLPLCVMPVLAMCVLSRCWCVVSPLPSRCALSWRRRCLPCRSEKTVDFEGGLFSFHKRNEMEPEIIVEPAPGDLPLYASDSQCTASTTLSLWT